MQLEQAHWTEREGWQPRPPGGLGASAQLLLVFGGRSVLLESRHGESLRRAYPQAHILGCSTAGEIFGTQVHDDSLVVTAVLFDHSEIRGARTRLGGVPDSLAAGGRLAASLPGKASCTCSSWPKARRSTAASSSRGSTGGLPKDVTVTGGLAGDGARFEETLVFWDGAPERNDGRGDRALRPAAARRLRLAGRLGSLRPERLITRSAGNVLLRARRQLGAGPLQDLPGGARRRTCRPARLLFPLSLRRAGRRRGRRAHHPRGRRGRPAA